MCGIVGLSSPRSKPADVASVVGRMADRVAHRGPDDQGIWSDPNRPLSLGHRRLAVIDLSPKGHQPMVLGNLVLVFNGEIYNYRQLRKGLESEGHRFLGDSDTEVLLTLIREQGLEPALAKCKGMFALALWDPAKRQLSLARDRFGEKPLYYGASRDAFAFASEIGALYEIPEWPLNISRKSLKLYLQHNCVPQPRTIFEELRQVRPGHYVVVDLGGNSCAINERPFWDARRTWEQGVEAASSRRPDSYVEEFEERLRKVVAGQMIADVPLGAFLSGGIDSSMVVAAMQAASGQPIRTFTIAFEEQAFNEAAYAREVANRLGTDHTEMTLSARDAISYIPKLPAIYGEPFADSSQLPTLLVSAATRKHVTVALTGDGGDEFFGGYSRYLDSVRAWKNVSKRSQWMREMLWRIARLSPDLLLTAVARAARPKWDIAMGGGASIRVADRLAFDTASDFGEYYVNQVSFWQSRSNIVRGFAQDGDGDDSSWAGGRATEDALRWMMFRDSQTYLNDDILTKVDRASMHSSLETRAPFLDHELASWAWSVPTGVHYHDGRGKWILRQALAKFIPPDQFERPKMGFAIPLGQWLRGELREWAESLLNSDAIRCDGWLNHEQIHARWRYHLSGDDRYSLPLWSVLMFQGWLQHFNESPAVAA